MRNKKALVFDCLLMGFSILGAAVLIAFSH